MLRLLWPRKRLEKTELKALTGVSSAEAGFGGTWQQKPPLSFETARRRITAGCFLSCVASWG